MKIRNTERIKGEHKREKDRKDRQERSLKLRKLVAWGGGGTSKIVRIGRSLG